MASPQFPEKHRISYEENAFFARLAALNTAFEAARAGKTARAFAHRALSSDALLDAFLQEIQAQKSLLKLQHSGKAT